MIDSSQSPLAGLGESLTIDTSQWSWNGPMAEVPGTAQALTAAVAQLTLPDFPWVQVEAKANVAIGGFLPVLAYRHFWLTNIGTRNLVLLNECTAPGAGPAFVAPFNNIPESRIITSDPGNGGNGNVDLNTHRDYALRNIVLRPGQTVRVLWVPNVLGNDDPKKQMGRWLATRPIPKVPPGVVDITGGNYGSYFDPLSTVVQPWLPADGRLLNKADYPDLWADYGTTWAQQRDDMGNPIAPRVPDDGPTFYVPDYRSCTPSASVDLPAFNSFPYYKGKETILPTLDNMEPHYHEYDWTPIIDTPPYGPDATGKAADRIPNDDDPSQLLLTTFTGNPDPPDVDNYAPYLALPLLIKT